MGFIVGFLGPPGVSVGRARGPPGGRREAKVLAPAVEPVSLDDEDGRCIVFVVVLSMVQVVCLIEASEKMQHTNLIVFRGWPYPYMES